MHTPLLNPAHVNDQLRGDTDYYPAVSQIDVESIFIGLSVDNLSPVDGVGNILNAGKIYRAAHVSAFLAKAFSNSMIALAPI